MKSFKNFVLFALMLAAVISTVACGSNTPTGPKQGANPTATPTVASTPVPGPAVVRFEVRTSCGGTANGVPVASDTIAPSDSEKNIYVLPFRTANEQLYCLRALQSGAPEGCSVTGPITTDQNVGIFKGKNTWQITDKAAYPPVSAGQLPRGANEQSLIDFGLELNPGTYPFTANLAWECSDGRKGIETGFIQIIMDNPNQ